MQELQNQCCTICGESRAAGGVWFLVAERLSEDKIRILHWHDGLAKHGGVHCACCPAHVQELVAYWMTLGSLTHLRNLAGSALGSAPKRASSTLPVWSDPDTSVARQNGELWIDRDGLSRAMVENPASLQILLDELSDALEQELSTVGESGEEALGVLHRA